LTQVWQTSMPRAGLAIPPGPLIVIPVAIISGRLAARLAHRPFPVIGSLICGAAGLWFLLMAGTEHCRQPYPRDGPMRRRRCGGPGG